MTKKGEFMSFQLKPNRLFTLLITLLAVLLVVASLLTSSAWVSYFSWGLMALSLGVTLFTLIQNDRQRLGGEPVRLRKRILIDTAGLLISTVAAVLAGLGVIELAQRMLSAVSGWAVLICLVLSFAAGWIAATIVRVGWKKVCERTA
jgi:Flp pilus assembly protein protease CpaA